MQAHGNLTASYLWQPGELARRMLGERPSPVPPTRDLWPPPPQPLSISTLHVAYLGEEPPPRRASTLPPQASCDYRPGLCTVGTNTDPPPTLTSRLRRLLHKQPPDDIPIRYPRPVRFTAPRETAIDEPEHPARRAISNIKKAISGAKYRIAPDTDVVESPKIVYEVPKPGDRMATTFGAREDIEAGWRWRSGRATLVRGWRAATACCAPAPRPPRRPAPRLQVTQV